MDISILSITTINNVSLLSFSPSFLFWKGGMGGSCDRRWVWWEKEITHALCILMNFPEPWGIGCHTLPAAVARSQAQKPPNLSTWFKDWEKMAFSLFTSKNFIPGFESALEISELCLILASLTVAKWTLIYFFFFFFLPKNTYIFLGMLIFVIKISTLIEESIG